jgi:hypothetical protein
VEGFLSAAFSSLRFVLSRRMMSSWPRLKGAVCHEVAAEISPVDPAFMATASWLRLRAARSRRMFASTAASSSSWTTMTESSGRPS